MNEQEAINEVEKKLGVGDRKLRTLEEAMELLQRAAALTKRHHTAYRVNDDRTSWGTISNAIRFTQMDIDDRKKILERVAQERKVNLGKSRT